MKFLSLSVLSFALALASVWFSAWLVRDVKYVTLQWWGFPWAATTFFVVLGFLLFGVCCLAAAVGGAQPGNKEKDNA
jgi:hypothetical protein